MECILLMSVSAHITRQNKKFFIGFKLINRGVRSFPSRGGGGGQEACPRKSLENFKNMQLKGGGVQDPSDHPPPPPCTPMIKYPYILCTIIYMLAYILSFTLESKMIIVGLHIITSRNVLIYIYSLLKYAYF